MANFIKTVKNNVEYGSTTEQWTINIDKLSKIRVETEEAKIAVIIQDTPGIEVVLETYEGGPELSTNLTKDELEIKALSTKQTFLRKKHNCRLILFVSSSIADNWELLTSSGEILCQQLTTKETHLKTSSGDITFSVLEDQNNVENSGAPSGDTYLSTSSGDVKIEKIKGRKLRIKTSSGDIHLHNLLMHEATLHSSSGDMTGEDICLEKLLFTSSSGNFLIKEVSGQLQGSTSSGDVKVTIVEQAPLEIGTSSGDISIGFLSSILDGKIRVETGSGEIKTNLVMDIEKQESNCLEGKIGQARTVYQMKARSGDVYIYEI
ncbi:DUF4097 family beta strand repeat-containing protein [Virgibacillus halodenitrificans]|uniref:DUF4097 family beta strand repeat-containing protein n=1 Tax=Virgibacillus halodenitrificans TaxID=1482 RepID=UPI001371754C